MTRVKICGITNLKDARTAVNAGASALGFVFYKKSPRYILPAKAKKIIDALPPFVTPVGVFVNERQAVVHKVCRLTGITTVQFHGEETPAYCGRFKDYKVIKAFRVREGFNSIQVKQYQSGAFLFDTFQESLAGGTGKTFNWDLLKGQKFAKPFILSGGLNSGNVRQAIDALSPYAVDVSSGVEKSPGIKDHSLVNAFCQAVRDF